MKNMQTNQTIWGWKIAAYLFGAGMGAGAFAFSGYLQLVPKFTESGVAVRGMWLGVVVTALSPAFLVWDLGKPMRFLRVLMNVAHSWLSRGAVILMTFCLVALITIVTGFPTALVWISIALALAVATYTGILLGSMLSRPLWNNSLLPMIFLTSALSTGIALLDVGGLATSATNSSMTSAFQATIANLRWAHAALLVVEIVMLYFFVNLSRSRSSTSADMLTKGNLKYGFWIGILGAGVVGPLALIAISSPTSGAASNYLLLVGDLGVLFGGFMLRRVILYVGTRGVVELGVRFTIRPEI